MSRLPQPPNIVTPLWLIFLFFCFTEIVLGFAVFKTSGGIQVALTTFVIGFPLLVVVAFFYLLIFRPENVFSPQEFQSDDSYIRIREIARASTVSLSQLDDKIEQKITQLLTSEQLVEKLSSLQGEQLTEALENAAANISDEIRETNFFTVSFTQIAPNLDDLTMPIDAFPTFSALLNSIWFRLGPAVEPFTYGTSWVLRDKASGKVFKALWMSDVPGRRKRQKLKPHYDYRPLEEVGMQPGMILEVVRLE
jgi:hypothetical protein